MSPLTPRLVFRWSISHTACVSHNRPRQPIFVFMFHACLLQWHVRLLEWAQLAKCHSEKFLNAAAQRKCFEQQCPKSKGDLLAFTALRLSNGHFSGQWRKPHPQTPTLDLRQVFFVLCRPDSRLHWPLHGASRTGPQSEPA